MKKIILGFVLALMFAVAANATAGEFVITGYADNQFAIKEPQKKQIAEGIKAMNETGRGPDSYLVIKVVGSADRTGRSADNDKLSKWRAETVKGELEFIMPNVKIPVVPEGDQDNVKQVKVQYYFAEPAHVPVKSEKEQGINMFAKFVLITMTLMFAIGFGLAFPYLNKTKDKAKQRNAVWIDSGNYSVKAEYINGKWHIPFRHLTGNHDRIYGDTLDDAASSIGRCLKPGSKFLDQISGLLGKDVIERKTKEGQAI